MVLDILDAARLLVSLFDDNWCWNVVTCNQWLVMSRLEIVISGSDNSNQENNPVLSSYTQSPVSGFASSGLDIPLCPRLSVLNDTLYDEEFSW